MREARDVVDAVLARGDAVYGLNTGLGSFARYRIPIEQLRRFSLETIADLSSSYGRPLPPDVVRAMIVARANGMAKAGVGVRCELAQLLVELLNRDVDPVVREIGSVGQGDLSEMSDIGKVVIGIGHAVVGGEVMSGRAALTRVGLEPIELASKEALALISANGVTLGRGALVLNDVAELVDLLQVAGGVGARGLRRQPLDHPSRHGPSPAAGRPCHGWRPVAPHA